MDPKDEKSIGDDKKKHRPESGSILADLTSQDEDDLSTVKSLFEKTQKTAAKTSLCAARTDTGKKIMRNLIPEFDSAKRRNEIKLHPIFHEDLIPKSSRKIEHVLIPNVPSYNPLDKKVKLSGPKITKKYPFSKQETTVIPDMTKPRVTPLGVVPSRNSKEVSGLNVLLEGSTYKPYNEDALQQIETVRSIQNIQAETTSPSTNSAEKRHTITIDLRAQKYAGPDDFASSFLPHSRAFHPRSSPSESIPLKPAILQEVGTTQGAVLSRRDKPPLKESTLKPRPRTGEDRVGVGSRSAGSRHSSGLIGKVVLLDEEIHSLYDKTAKRLSDDVETAVGMDADWDTETSGSITARAVNSFRGSSMLDESVVSAKESFDNLHSSDQISFGSVESNSLEEAFACIGTGTEDETDDLGPPPVLNMQAASSVSVSTAQSANSVPDRSRTSLSAFCIGETKSKNFESQPSNVPTATASLYEPYLKSVKDMVEEAKSIAIPESPPEVKKLPKNKKRAPKSSKKSLDQQSKTSKDSIHKEKKEDSVGDRSVDEIIQSLKKQSTCDSLSQTDIKIEELMKRISLRTLLFDTDEASPHHELSLMSSVDFSEKEVQMLSDETDLPLPVEISVTETPEVPEEKNQHSRPNNHVHQQVKLNKCYRARDHRTEPTRKAYPECNNTLKNRQNKQAVDTNQNNLMVTKRVSNSNLNNINQRRWQIHVRIKANNNQNYGGLLPREHAVNNMIHRVNNNMVLRQERWMKDSYVKCLVTDYTRLVNKERRSKNRHRSEKTRNLLWFMR